MFSQNRVKLRVTELVVDLEANTLDELTVEMQEAHDAGRLAAQRTFELVTTNQEGQDVD